MQRQHTEDTNEVKICQRPRQEQPKCYAELTHSTRNVKIPPKQRILPRPKKALKIIGTAECEQEHKT